MSKNYDELEKELQQVLEQLDKGGISIEESVALYEKGTILISKAQEALKEAENKITLLTNNISGTVVEKPINIDTDK